MHVANYFLQLELYKGKNVKINLEIKTNKIQYPGKELESYQMIKEMGMLDQVLFSSFYVDSLYKLRAIDSSLYLGYLFEDDYEKNNVSDYIFNFLKFLFAMTILTPFSLK